MLQAKRLFLLLLFHVVIFSSESNQKLVPTALASSKTTHVESHLLRSISNQSPSFQVVSPYDEKTQKEKDEEKKAQAQRRKDARAAAAKKEREPHTNFNDKKRSLLLQEKLGAVAIRESRLRNWYEIADDYWRDRFSLFYKGQATHLPGDNFDDISEQGDVSSEGEFRSIPKEPFDQTFAGTVEQLRQDNKKHKAALVIQQCYEQYQNNKKVKESINKKNDIDLLQSEQVAQEQDAAAKIIQKSVRLARAKGELQKRKELRDEQLALYQEQDQKKEQAAVLLQSSQRQKAAQLQGARKKEECDLSQDFGSNHFSESQKIKEESVLNQKSVREKKVSFAPDVQDSPHQKYEKSKTAFYEITDLSEESDNQEAVIYEINSNFQREGLLHNEEYCFEKLSDKAQSFQNSFLSMVLPVVIYLIVKSCQNATRSIDQNYYVSIFKKMLASYYFKIKHQKVIKSKNKN